MTDHANEQRKSLIAHLDSFVFIKNGYSVWIHLIPFAIVALLVLMLSVTTDNLLMNIVKELQQPSWIWLPAVLLTAVAAAVYIITVNVQIRQAYLWSKYNLRRTMGTSLIYIFLCTLMTYAVLKSVSPYEKTTLVDIWACLLIAVLSLSGIIGIIGIGWKRPSSWGESIGVKSPNYTNSHQSVKELTEILQRVRTNPYSCKDDVKNFSDEAEKLRINIDLNLKLEPGWAKNDLQEAIALLNTLHEQVRKKFNNVHAVMNFAEACRYKDGKYGSFGNTLKQLSNYWPEWHYTNT